jgi:hypothetical protein
LTLLPKGGKSVNPFQDGSLETLKAQLKADADLKLETYRATLKGQSDVELEKLRSSLAMAAAERHATHAGLVQRRFDAIAATHGQLLRFHQRVAQLVQAMELAGGPSREQRAKEVADTFTMFDAAYQDQKIFLSKRTADRIDAI